MEALNWIVAGLLTGSIAMDAIYIRSLRKRLERTEADLDHTKAWLTRVAREARAMKKGLTGDIQACDHCSVDTCSDYGYCAKASQPGEDL